MFKTGDKVRIKSAELQSYWYAACVGDVFTLVEYDAYDNDWSVEEGDGWVSASDIELIQQFDLKKNPWFIRTGTKEKSEAAQKWLFEQGIGWLYFGEQVNQYDENFLTNVRDDGEVTGYIMHAQEPHESAQEIILEFSTIVKFGTFPIVESEQDKKIKELQQTIEKAQKQIEELKNMNS